LSREDNSLKSNLNRFTEVEAVGQSTMPAEQQACEKLPNKMGPNPIDTSSLSRTRSQGSSEIPGRKEDKLLSTISSLPGEGLNHKNVDYTKMRCQAF